MSEYEIPQPTQDAEWGARPKPKPVPPKGGRP